MTKTEWIKGPPTKLGLCLIKWDNGGYSLYEITCISETHPLVLVYKEWDGAVERFDSRVFTGVEKHTYIDPPPETPPLPQVFTCSSTEHGKNLPGVFWKCFGNYPYQIMLPLYTTPNCYAEKDVRDMFTDIEWIDEEQP